ncbi:MAG: hypothetical protein IJW16_02150 [Clostridia bacterium]|nr:hypothetical protein [Clostridia bacterium]
MSERIDFIDRLSPSDQEKLTEHALELLAKHDLPVEGVGKYANRDKKLKNAMKRRGLTLYYSEGRDPCDGALLVRFCLVCKGKAIDAKTVKMLWKGGFDGQR